jgi:hypothetical protein
MRPLGGIAGIGQKCVMPDGSRVGSSTFKTGRRGP